MHLLFRRAILLIGSFKFIKKGYPMLLKIYFTAILYLVLLLAPNSIFGQSSSKENAIGLKIRVGGRFDNVRMCVASPAGTKGGPALEVSFYGEKALSENKALAFDIPLFRPILFAAAFKMFQFDPDVSLLFKNRIDNDRDFIAGPTLAFSLHYGPDYNSDKSNRGESFWAIGPRIGGYFAVDFKRDSERMNFQLGIHPYITPMFAIDSKTIDNGIVSGAILDGLFKFKR